MSLRNTTYSISATLLITAALWWFFELPGVPSGLRRTSEPTPPVNVVIIAIDTMRTDFLGLSERPWIKAPNIKSLAADGTWFSRCQTTAPWTGPSFASLYTGLLPYRHGFFNRNFNSLDPDNPTMAEIFADNGYRTGGWVTIAFLTHAFGMHRGLQTGDKFTDHADGQTAHLVTASAARFTSSSSQKPFYMFLHYFDVHAPYTPPAPYDKMYVEGDPYSPGTPLLDRVLDPRINMEAHNTELYQWLNGVTDPDYPVAQYAAGVSYVDSHVGQVVSDLKEKGLYDETLIILVGDHGEHLGEHNIYYAHALPYEEVLQVPLIIKWPSSFEREVAVIEQRVSIMDVLPTVLEAVNLPVPDALDGHSLVKLARGKTSSTQSLLVAEQGESPDSYCKTITDGDWKLMLFKVESKFIPVLFNLADDPAETRNVAADHTDVTNRLAARLWEIFDPETPFGDYHVLSEKTVDEKELKRLKSLGYIR